MEGLFNEVEVEKVRPVGRSDTVPVIWVFSPRFGPLGRCVWDYKYGRLVNQRVIGGQDTHWVVCLFLHLTRSGMGVGRNSSWWVGTLRGRRLVSGVIRNESWGFPHLRLTTRPSTCSTVRFPTPTWSWWIPDLTPDVSIVPGPSRPCGG